MRIGAVCFWMVMPLGHGSKFLHEDFLAQGAFARFPDFEGVKPGGPGRAIENALARSLQAGCFAAKAGKTTSFSCEKWVEGEGKG